MMCADCHMPLVPSKDEGSLDGYVHSSPLPWRQQPPCPSPTKIPRSLKTSRKFLQDSQLSVDIFAVSPVSKNESAKKNFRLS